MKERENHKELSKLKLKIQPEYLSVYKKKFERFREVDGSPTSRKGFGTKFINIVNLGYNMKGGSNFR